MHLINIHTEKLEEFIQSKVPPYAILSHRWGSPEEELNFKEVSKQRIDRRKEGYRKLARACRTAAAYEVDYLWIDTCCIDKKSSAELTEAINSMFSWYQDAKICLAYLHDVTSGQETDETSSGSELNEFFNSSEHDRSFRSSVWFTRSWTLQELLAPKDVAFFNGSWNYIGTKISKAEAIEAVTGIPGKALRQPSSFRDSTICEKMSWASDRHATRPEDIAYSLMGIFDVNMPLLYGEGMKAFTRLQEEIIRRATDPSFLLWGFGNKNSSLLASTPVDFRNVRGPGMGPIQKDVLFTLTNIGLEIHTNWLIRYRLDTYAMVIGESSSATYVVLLKKHHRADTFYRIGIDKFALRRLHWARSEKITILRSFIEWDARIKKDLEDVHYGFHVRTDPSILASPARLGNFELILARAEEAQWRTSTDFPVLLCTLTDPSHPGVASMTCRLSNSQTLCLDLSFDFDSRPCLLLTGSADVMKLRRKSRSPWVWELSDTIKSRMKHLGYKTTFRREVELCKITDETPLSVSYFLRCDEKPYSVSARLPPELATLEDPVWISLIRPHYLENNSSSWLITISTPNPIHLHGQ